MSCAACSARVEKAVNSVEGVESCSVSLLTNSMGVEGTASDEDIINAVISAGYGASPKKRAESVKKESDDDRLKDTETPILLKRLWQSVGFLIVLMYFSMGHMLGIPMPPFLSGNHTAVAVIQLLLTVVIMFINRKFFISGFRAVIRRSPNMDTLVALGSAAAFGWSLFVLYLMTDAVMKGDNDGAGMLMHELYFESAAMILTLITVGKTLESRSKGRTTDALKGLMKLAPDTANVIRGENEVTIPAAEVQVGDIFAVRAGENIPVDGVVISGGAAVSEAALTGESIPVEKAAGDSVFAGTVNNSGYMRCRASRVGEDTSLSQIIQLVSDAAATKAPIAKIADKVSGIFVPTVIAIAAVTTAVWLLIGYDVGFALARGISVLVISCPCALGLATPVAIMVGSGKGAKNGILFKTAASLEEAGRIKIVALDKTGTITEGRPQVTEIVPADGVSENELMECALALEIKSEHPLGRAVVEKAEELGIKPPDTEDFSVLAGSGLSAVMNGRKLLGGSERFISENSEIPVKLTARSAELAEKGNTPLYFAADGKVLGMIAAADVIKSDSREAVSALRKMGVSVVMLTGDNEKTARAVAEAAGVDEVFAGVLPDGKQEVIEKLRKRGTTAMVGDGINDAPALTSADVGIAIGAGTDIAIDAADVVLMKSRLSDVPSAVRLSRAVLRNIRQNLFWAFIYNIIGIPLAAGALIPLGITLNPMFGAAAMSLSSFCVVSNALRLNLIKLGCENEIITEKTEEKKMEKTMTITGMMCAHCEAHVKKALEAIDGVVSAAPDHNTNTAVVTISGEVSDEALTKAVADAGYTVEGIN